ncbi:hypothetical protein JMI89_11685 [Frischella sp. Ac48]|uniref:CDI immunity protein domain-containing protein n=1 Tax=Frischella japonica TaxID=2741544 RepID=A0ABR7R003_9GAMM|nr:MULTISPECIES: hypothetical protein [Frischella]MBC9131788.1 hypothetical protein [Frischella japonica]MBX4134286.1 hypothetical protein [Frischella sp. Ac48]
MNNTLQWLETTKKLLIDNGGAELYCLLEVMCKEQKMNFLQLIYDASKGIGANVSEGVEYILDQDLDNPEEFDGVTFVFGDCEGYPMPLHQFITLMQIVSDAYINAHPSEKDSIEFYMNKLRERYSK